MREDAGVSHEQLLAGPRFAPEHDPAEADLCIDGQDDLGQLHLADALIEPRAQPGDFGILLVGGQRRQVQLVVHAQRAGACGLGHGVDTGAHALEQRGQEVARLGRQLQPGVVTPCLGLPALVGDEQSLSATKAQRMLEPDRAVAQGAAQREQGGHLQRAECPLAVSICDSLAPSWAQACCRDVSGQTVSAAGVLGAQLVHGVEDWMFAGGPPGQPAHGHQKRAHGRDGVDQALANDRRATGRALRPLDRNEIAQARAQFGVGNRVLGRKAGQLLQELLVLLGPVDRSGDAVGALSPQVGDTALEHENELVTGCEQAVAQEAGHLDRARRLLDSGADRRRARGHASCIAAHEHVVELAQVTIDAQLREKRDPLEDLADLARGMLGRRTPQPALAGLAVRAHGLHGRWPALQDDGRHLGTDGSSRGSLEFGQGCGHQGADRAVVHDDESMLVEPMPGTQEQSLAVGAVRDFIAQDPHERATLVFGHPGKAQDLAGLLLVIEQGAAAGVQRTQRRQIRRLDLQHRSQVPQQHRRHGTNAVGRSAAHAHEADMQRQTQLVVVAAPTRDQLKLIAAEAEKSLQLEFGELTREVAQAKVGRLPALHRRRSRSCPKADDDTPRQSEQQRH